MTCGVTLTQMHWQPHGGPVEAQLGRDGVWQPFAAPVDWAPSAHGIQLYTSPNLLSDFPKEPSLQNTSLCPVSSSAQLVFCRRQTSLPSLACSQVESLCYNQVIGFGELGRNVGEPQLNGIGGPSKELSQGIKNVTQSPHRAVARKGTTGLSLAVRSWED